jgi:FkbM family methyltransferase
MTGTTEEILVPSLTLNNVIKEDLLLLKVDVEGWEWSVMKGAEELLRNLNVENIIMEYSPGSSELRRVSWLPYMSCGGSLQL